MTSTTAGSAPATDRTTTELPLPALLVLGGATLVMVTGEMLPTAVLAPMSAGLGVSDSAAGLLVSIWAAVVVVASFPLVHLVRHVPRTLVITGSLVAFGVASALTALAPSYGVVVGARTLGAAAVGLLWATVNAHVADLVPDRLLGRATAIVLGGATLGMVLGTPVGRFVADLAGWRAAFWTLAVGSVLAAVLVRAVVPAVAAPPAGTTADGPHRQDGALRPMVAVTVLVALALVGHYGAFTFVTRLGEPADAVLPGGMGSVLLAFGVASAAGVALAGRVTGDTRSALVVATAATAAALLALGAAGDSSWLVLGSVVTWGVVSGALPPLAQTLVLRLAGPAHRTLAGALIPVLFNGGIAVGAAFAAGTVAIGGTGALVVPAAGLVALAAAGLAAGTVRARR
ncbi:MULTISPECIES: MFS transporter [unclassified Nocardioides]|uniref:MFS transporter n=1 Tax=unclassified Nocardioides TaxID=2615069 RepID=UPI0007037BBB|nr:MULTISPECIES: MFS transporter [unclassified Nocardioides]KRC49056.1 MFS transporter [Nocardioides sp. Root79]KRC75457.1 MFS transporter [Nocardioides sp. Root240]